MFLTCLHPISLTIFSPNNTYDVLFNGESQNRGNLLEDFKPPVNPDKEIDDAEDKKPEDWVDEKKIADPDAKKPDDWDEDAPYEIEDEEAEKPEGWLDDEPETIPDPGALYTYLTTLMVAELCLRRRETGGVGRRRRWRVDRPDYSQPEV